MNDNATVTTSRTTRRHKRLGDVFAISLAFLVGACMIQSVTQPESVGQNEVFEVSLDILTTEVPENPPGRRGIVGVLAPSDWQFVAGSYEADEEGVSGTFELSPDYADSAEKAIPAPEGYAWIAVISADSQSFAADGEAEPFKAVLQLQAGEQTGDFELGYLTTGEDIDFDEEAFTNQWIDTLMSQPISVTPGTSIEDVIEDGLPTQFVLEQNYPNPFNPTTSIEYSLPRTMHARLVVYNVLGREVATIVDGVQSAGEHTRRVDAAAWSSGVYFYTLETDGRSVTRQMIVLK